MITRIRLLWWFPEEFEEAVAYSMVKFKPDYLRDPSLSEDTFRRLLKIYLFALY